MNSSCGVAPAVVFYEGCMLRQERQLFLRKRDAPLWTAPVRQVSQRLERRSTIVDSSCNSYRLKVLRCLHFDRNHHFNSSCGTSYCSCGVGWDGKEGPSTDLTTFEAYGSGITKMTDFGDSWVVFCKDLFQFSFFT